MPYTPPSHPSPAASAPHSPVASCCGLYQPGQTLKRVVSSRPVKSAAFAPTHETTPLSTADNEKNNTSSLPTNSSLRQSPPVTDDSKVPAGAVISPPDSGQNSRNNEETKSSRGRKLDNLAELQAAIRTLGHRDNRTTAEIEKTIQALHLIMPSKDAQKPAEALESTQGLRKIAYNRLNADSSVLGLHSDLSAETHLTGSDGDYSDDDNKLEQSWRKPLILRKKSGELIRPALRPLLARQRPSTMPSTPTFSKAVHFDSHLEHIRRFLQVDRPLAVSAGLSPVEAYNSDTKFPFSEEDNSNCRSPLYKWELVVSSSLAETPQRLLVPVRVERVFLSADNKILIGSVAVANLAFNKIVVVRFTLDYWKTTSEVVAEYNDDVCQQKNTDSYDHFNFNVKLADQANLEAKTMFFCVKYVVNGQEYWDNNNSTNFRVDFRKKYKP